MAKYYGHKTMIDGTHVPLTKDEANALWAASEEADKRRREAMPDSISALRAMHDARTRLRDEGWKDGIYCPKDETEFAVIEYGSTGIFSAFYSGEWPTGFLHVGDGISHPRGVLWKPIADLTDEERARFDECVETEKQMIAAESKRFAAMFQNDENERSTNREGVSRGCE